MTQVAIAYKIYLDRLNQHLLRIRCTIQNPCPDGQIVSFPNWLPGSYTIRDFAKHIVAIDVISDNGVSLHKVNKNTWRCSPCTGPLTIEYLVYCFDQAPRSAYVDNRRVFFDGCRIFLVVNGEEEQTHDVEIIASDKEGTDNWQVATSMTAKNVNAKGYGVYTANNHLELIDHPFEIGELQIFKFKCADCIHKIVFSAHIQADFKRLTHDIEKICAKQIALFGELPEMHEYIFFVNVHNKSWGGIEHRTSCSLATPLSSLPQPDMKELSSDYIILLGLFSHEYFHLWNVKRIKPEVFINPDLNIETYTEQLWIFEGITSYFDNLALVTSGVISQKEYLKLLQNDINNMLLSPANTKQSLAEASFDAWIKFYHPDENSINANVSYYAKGSLVALLLDLLIISNSKNKQSLVDVMQVLWQQFGKVGIGLPENYFAHVVYEVTGEDYSSFFTTNIQERRYVELEDVMQKVGISFTAQARPYLDSLGIRLQSDKSSVKVKSILNDSNAEYAGMAPNDTIIALNDNAVTAKNFESLLKSYQSDAQVKLHVFRNDRLLELTLLNTKPLKNCYELAFMEDITQEQLAQRNKWLSCV